MSSLILHLSCLILQIAHLILQISYLTLQVSKLLKCVKCSLTITEGCMAGDVDWTLGVDVLPDSLFGVVVSRSDDERGDGERTSDAAELAFRQPPGRIFFDSSRSCASLDTLSFR